MEFKASSSSSSSSQSFLNILSLCQIKYQENSLIIIKDEIFKIIKLFDCYFLKQKEINKNFFK